MHGGLIRLPFIGGILSPQVKLFPKYDAGQYTLNNSYMVISRGLGGHSFMPRFLNPPQLVNIKLINKKEVL
jgi:predicted MPP superfamily phosphohydrolase